MKTASVIHGVWGAIAVTAFVLGSQLFPAGGKSSAAGSGTGSGASASKSGSGNLSQESGGSAAGNSKARRLARGKGTGDEGGGTSNTALSDEEIKTLGEKFREAASPIDRRLAFSRMLEGLTAENAKLVREQIAHLPAHSAEFREFHYAWGAAAGAEAIMFGADTPKADMAPALAGWASANPAAAMKWFEGLDIENDSAFDNLLKDRKVPAAELRNHLMGGLVQGLADADPDAAGQFVVGLADDGHKGAERFMHIVMGAVLRTNSPAEAATWSESLPEGKLRGTAMGRIAGHFASNDPKAAAEWAEGYADRPEANQVVHTVGATWAHRDPESAIEWLDSLPSSEGRSRAIGSAFSAWAGRNAEVAGKYITQMQPSPERDSAISGFANRIVHEDPVTGVEWAASVSNPDAREQALIRTGQVYFRRNAEAAREWLATSGLSPEAQQRVLSPPKGDRDRRDGRD